MNKGDGDKKIDAIGREGSILDVSVIFMPCSLKNAAYKEDVDKGTLCMISDL